MFDREASQMDHINSKSGGWISWKNDSDPK
jgi:hypothetical protein